MTMEGAPVLIDIDLDFWATPRRTAATVGTRGFPCGQRIAEPGPTEVYKRLMQLGYGLPEAQLVSSHEHALDSWWPNTPTRGATVVHLDAHHDLWAVADPYRPTCSDFLRWACETGTVGRVIWVVPNDLWPEVALADLMELDESIFESGGGFEAQIGSVPVTAVPLSKLPPAMGPVAAVTLSLSPEWIDAPLWEPLARQVSRLFRADLRGVVWRGCKRRPEESERERGFADLMAAANKAAASLATGERV